MLPLAAVEAQREREGGAEVFGRCGREALGVVCLQKRLRQ
jgi:hypothetical protein